jgi:hypothetical protein
MYLSTDYIDCQLRKKCVTFPSKILSYCNVFWFTSQYNGGYKRHCKYNTTTTISIIDNMYSNISYYFHDGDVNPSCHHN